jgi:hypothetical protein
MLVPNLISGRQFSFVTIMADNSIEKTIVKLKQLPFENMSSKHRDFQQGVKQNTVRLPGTLLH